MYVASDPEATKAGAPPSYVKPLADELSSFNAYFDLLDKNSAIKSTLPSEDQQLSIYSICKRRNASEAAGPDTITDYYY